MRKLKMAESKTTAKKAPAKKPAVKKAAPKKESNSLVVMVNDEGKTANVHPSMVDEYKAGGYKEA
jgi:hypothetical protein